MFDKKVFDQLAANVKIEAVRTHEAVKAMLVAKEAHTQAALLHGTVREVFRNYIRKHTGVTL